MIELFVKRSKRRLDVCEVRHPSGVDADIAANMHFQPERVTMNPRALVTRGHIRQAMGGFEPQFPVDFHGVPRSW
jgi:hypothetical protein